MEKRALMTGSELLSDAMTLGSWLLACGAEIYRVEESIRRMCLAYGAADAQVYAVPTAIIATVRMDENHVETQVRRIEQRGTDLNRVNALNALCRSVCAHPIPHEEFWARMQKIADADVYPPIVRCLASGGVALFFTLLFGGAAADGLLALIVGCLLEVLMELIGRIGSNPLFLNVLGGAWIAFAALSGVRLGLGQSYDLVIMGSIMPLVPGLMMTNAIRDLIAGDFMSGITRFAAALLHAAGIAVGAAISLGMSSLLLGGF
ncbi:MAG: threonine/serine exporter family protein [Clostridiales bacterium]|nr:threonine/serine exporter family protein [Clostridiales bacterium]